MKTRLTSKSTAVLIAAATLILVFGSPLLLWLVQHTYPFDWQLLSAVGQSYTGIGTLLSLLAFAGVVYSIVLQTRQTIGQQQLNAREMQFKLVEMALNDVELGSLHSPTGLRSPASYKKYRVDVFIVLRFRHLQYSYLTELFDDEGLRARLRDEYFNSRQIRARWMEVEPIWRRAFREGAERRFCDILGEECRALDGE